jgi:hypothetical protein
LIFSAGVRIATRMPIRAEKAALCLPADVPVIDLLDVASASTGSRMRALGQTNSSATDEDAIRTVQDRRGGRSRGTGLCPGPLQGLAGITDRSLIKGRRPG